MITTIIAAAVMALIFLGLPIAWVLLLRPKTTIGARSSFSRWWSANRDRTEAAKEIARLHGMRYIGDTLAERHRIEHFFYFTGRSVGAMVDVVVGEEEAIREMLFSTTASRSFVYTLAQFTSPGLMLPQFRISARDFPFRDLTSREISFPDVPAFSAAYEVHGEPEAEVRAVLDARVRAALTAAGSVLIEGKPNELLCVSSEDYTLRSEREEFLRRARTIVATLLR